MPLFEYKAISDRGKKMSATIDADSLQDAKLKLIRRQIAAFEIAPLESKQIKDHLNRKELLNLTKEISRLLSAGLPLFEALTALEEKYTKQKPHRILLSLADQVRSGYTFSQGLQKHSKTFDILYVSMVRNAENTGRLNEALDELTELIEKEESVRKQLTSALLYPAVLFSFCTVVLSSLLFYVIPSLKELFDGRDLHPFTKIVFAVSNFACTYKGALGLFILFVVSLIILTFFSKKQKKRLRSIQFRIPIIKEILAKVALTRFSRAFATLLEGGLPLIQALDQAKRVMNHPDLEKVIQKAEEKIKEGESIHSSFENEPLIPPLIPRMISIAEEGGKLSFMMTQIAEIYEEELEKTLTHFAAVAQPILLLILGAIIGFVLLSVLLPMTDVSSFAT